MASKIQNAYKKKSDIGKKENMEKDRKNKAEEQKRIKKRR